MSLCVYSQIAILAVFSLAEVHIENILNNSNCFSTKKHVLGVGCMVWDDSLASLKNVLFSCNLIFFKDLSRIGIIASEVIWHLMEQLVYPLKPILIHGTFLLMFLGLSVFSWIMACTKDWMLDF